MISDLYIYIYANSMLAVQISSFKCGGMAIGICISHRIADVRTLSSFIKWWAASASASHDPSATNSYSPVFNSAAVFPPRNTPDYAPNSSSPSVQPLSPNLVTRRFVFPSSAIEALKLEAAAAIPPVLKPTRVEVVTAFIWHRCMAAKGVNKSVAFHSVNLRGRIPALSENSFGNLFQMTRAESGGEAKWTQLVGKIRAAFEEIDDEYIEKLLGEKGFELAKENFMGIARGLREGSVEVFRFNSHCKLGVNELADFGWGRPIWVSNSNYRKKNFMLFIDSVEWKDGIEAWIVMSDEDMGRLHQDLEFRNFALG